MAPPCRRLVDHRCRHRALLLLLPLLGTVAWGCGGSSTPSDTKGMGIPVVASINAWGSILAQLGGTHVRSRSLITNPNTDPHSYEPTPADGRAVAGARLMVVNGVGYDAWADKLMGAEPDPARVVVNVGGLVGADPGANPHLWYSPSDVAKVADAITSSLKALDAVHAAYFDEQRQRLEGQGLTRYHSLIAEIRARYGGVAVGASESIFAPLSEALGLRLLTPPSFLRAISEGVDPSPGDKATVDAQISTKAIRVYVYNTQNSTPDVAAQVDEAKAKGIPVVAVTETLSPTNATFQEWQSAQLQALEDALGRSA